MAYIKNAITTQVVFTVLDCPKCGALHGIPEETIERRQKDGELTYCPNGHSYSWSDTEEKKLRRALQQAEAERDAARATALEQTAKAKQLANDLMDKVQAEKRLAKRLHAGVCPQCHRQFVNVQRHMASKHGDPAERKRAGQREQTARDGCSG